MTLKEKMKVRRMFRLAKKRSRLKAKVWKIETKIDPLYHFRDYMRKDDSND